MRRFVHISSGREYSVMRDDVVCATNGPQDQQIMVLYTDSTLWFVREREEFMQKFRETTT